MTFSENLAERMKQRCETKYALAKEIGVSQSTVANWLDGSATPRLRYIGRLAEHYGCEIAELHLPNMEASEDTT